MIVIDIPADLNAEDDRGRNVARLPEGRKYTAGDLAVAGRPDGWSWAVVAEVAEGFIYFRQVTAREAAQHGGLVAGA